MEKVRAANFLPKAMGEKAYKLIWEPQLINKFGDPVRYTREEISWDCDMFPRTHNLEITRIEE